ncbi:MAG: Ppx/GppA family phosphatase [Phycisphaeraceae bacterium]|nr:Ppx/GppA family phosphatase [Phycisphaeraceae bacterium]
MDTAPTASSKPADVRGPLRLAAIDVGSNSIRLLIAERDDEGGYHVLDEEKVSPRLGHGMTETGLIAPDRLEEAIGAVERMKQIALGYGVAQVRVIATSAVREASNGGEFVQGVARLSNLAVEVIGHEDEGRLAHKSVVAAFDVRKLPFAVADIGGGSTEVVFSRGGAVEKVVGLKLGAVRVADMFGGARACEPKTFDEMRQYLKGAIEVALSGSGGKMPIKPKVLFGTGGTYSALASIQQARDGLPTDNVQGHRLSRERVNKILVRVRNALEKGESVPGLSKERTDIILPGAAIVEALMLTLKVDELVVHDRGIRDGLMLSMLEAHTNTPAGRAGRGAGTTARISLGSRAESVRRFARRCRYHEAHSEHVTQLALEIFDQLAEQLPAVAKQLSKDHPAHPLVLDPMTAMDEDGRGVLEAAGVLHDIGYLVNHNRHHKHSAYIIANSELDGYSPRERDLIANIARYHRRGHPKTSHAPYKALDNHDRKIVRRLSGILRVADGLDRTHTQVVDRVSLKIEATDGADHPNTVTFIVESGGDASTDIWGSQRKSELFSLAYGLRCAFEMA